MGRMWAADVDGRGWTVATGTPERDAPWGATRRVTAVPCPGSRVVALNDFSDASGHWRRRGSATSPAVPDQTAPVGPCKELRGMPAWPRAFGSLAELLPTGLLVAEEAWLRRITAG